MITKARTEPRTYSYSWSGEIGGDPADELARCFVKNLGAVFGVRSLSGIETITDVGPATLSRILNGHAWPDGYTIARLKGRLGVHLWPA
ncbi:hypothetical protein [Kocuria turfanensis]|uniref:HTH cro/C1-type domain-containing protein n=1 Tax=Kocuria turfanensis TaxID=388357 RepID=A0A512IH30_9MICC|nr:hypothetical protein [Kocuria turfanensis]GEO96980.1 hypothetical protein KTU01_31030 [Kocuria turfanensis]